MRTTIDIDPDVLQVAKEIAVRERSTAGRVLSSLARKALGGVVERLDGTEAKFVYKDGIPTLLRRGGPMITLEDVQRLKDEEDL